MIKTDLATLIILLVCATLTGCATAPLVEPTFEEMEASRAYKETVAIVEITDKDSQLWGVEQIALAQLEEVLMQHFNLQERGEATDYLLFANVGVFDAGSEVESAVWQEENKEFGRTFRGGIWREVCIKGEISLKMVDADNGMVAYADTKRACRCIKVDEVEYSDKKQFEKDLRKREIAHQVLKILGSFKKLEKPYSFMVSETLAEAARQFKRDFLRKFAQSGEVIDIISPKEVVINLGSAYGIKPGNKLIVWQEMPAITDPKTGYVTVPKEEKGTLKVTAVTSGLTCVAQGKKSLISSLRIGDKVYTY